MALNSRSSSSTVNVVLPPGVFFNVNVAEWFGSVLPTVGQKVMAASIPVVIASDQSSIPINDGGGSITVDGAVTVSGGPVSVTDGGGSLTVDTPQLPAALVGGRLDTNVGAWLGSTAPTVGQKTMANSVPVVIASDQSTVTVGGAVTVSGGPVSVTDGGGSLTVDTPQLPAALVGGRLDENLGAWLGSTAPTVGQKTMANSVPTVLASDQTAIPVTDNGGSLTVDTPQLPAALVGGRLDENVGAWLGSTAPTVGQKTMANSVPVVISSDQSTVPIGGAVTVSGGPVSVTDGGGSLTVDTPQLPAALVGGRLDENVGAWLGSTAPTVGQKTAANSVPTVLASDQSAIPITDNAGSLTIDTPQLPAALVGGRLDENVGAWLGSTAPTVGQKTMANSVPVVLASDQTTIGTSSVPSAVASYMASTNGVIATATAATTVNSIAYLFHPGANTKRVKIWKIWVAWDGNGGNNVLSLRGNFITAENGVPGGTSQTINALEQSDAASTLTFRTGATGAPTRVAGDLISLSMLGGSSAQNTDMIFDASQFGKPIVLRANVAEGFEVRTVIGGSNLASAVSVSVYYLWTEE